jgi:hypothetical protein
MKLRQAVLGLVALVVLAIAFGVGRYFQMQPGPLARYAHQITVQSGGSAGCEVDTPVVVVHFSTDTVQWLSNDNQYTIDFINIAVPPPPPTYPPLPPGYVAETPLSPPDKQVTIDKNHPSRIYHVQQNTKYYYYAIKDGSNNVCKVSTDDQDTGLSVKR